VANLSVHELGKRLLAQKENFSLIEEILALILRYHQLTEEPAFESDIFRVSIHSRWSEGNYIVLEVFVKGRKRWKKDEKVLEYWKVSPYGSIAPDNHRRKFIEFVDDSRFFCLMT